jgi:glyoxylase-like metal-dependent hydrolase (beta-lactamase superfamily II)
MYAANWQVSSRPNQTFVNAREIAKGVFRLGSKWVNLYLVVEGDEAVLLDSGYPRYWKQIAGALKSLGSGPSAITAVIVTHHHVDHAGTAEQARSVAGANVFVHERDAPMVKGERRSHVPPGFYRQAWRPSMAAYLAHTVAAGGAKYRPVSRVETITDDQVLDVAGRPLVVATPGHTAGHCSVVLEDRGVLFAGDALVNFDYATGSSGLGQHRFNEDRVAALASLDRLNRFDAETLLFGHGDPWTQGARQALDIVRERAAADGAR